MAKKFELFVNPNENGVAQIGSKRGSILFNGFVDKEYCVLSDRRLYYKGVSYGTGNMGGKAKSEIVIDLASITSTGFCIIKHIGLLLLSLLFMMAGVVGMVALRDQIAVGVAGLIVGGIFLLLYFLIRKRLMQIVYSGGRLMLQCWGQPEANMRAFCNAIHAAADRQKAMAQEVEIHEPVPVFQVGVMAPAAPAAPVVSAEPAVPVAAET